MIQVYGRFRNAIHDRDGRLVDLWECPNGVTLQGITDLLNINFGADSKNAAYYMGLIADAATITLSSADTIASHAGWTESTSYNEANRQTLTFGTASNGVIITSLASFTASSSITLGGIFVATNSTKGGSTGKLWATGLFGSTRSAWQRVLTGGQVFSSYYQISMSAG